jgi:hypothetical protein
VNNENKTAMYLDLDSWDMTPVEKTDLKIIRASSKNELLDFASVLVNDKKALNTYWLWVSEVITDEDPIEFFMGYLNGKPVARGLTCYFAGIAGFYFIAGEQDYSDAMRNFQISEAKAKGYHVAVLQISESDSSLYQKDGFKEFCTFRKYVNTA